MLQLVTVHLKGGTRRVSTERSGPGSGGAESAQPRCGAWRTSVASAPVATGRGGSPRVSQPAPPDIAGATTADG